MDEIDPDETVAALLVRARPVPDAAYVEATERRLLGRAPRRATPARRLRLAAVLGGGLAAVVAGATLAGSGPLGSDDRADAGDRCADVRVVRQERQGRVERDAAGRAVVTYRRVPVTRIVRRCR